MTDTRPHAAQDVAAATLALQTQLEAMYLRSLTLERDVIALRAQQPVVVLRPPRAGLLRRALRRLSGRARRRHHLSLIRGCGLFDADWYLHRNDDVAQSGMDPAEHYLHHGAADLRDPGPYFDTGHYLRLYPDIAQGGINPLVHYVLAGIDEGRAIRPGMVHGQGARAAPHT